MKTELSYETLDSTLSHATQEVFQTMLTSGIELKHAVDDCKVALYGDRLVVAGSVGFSGDIVGNVHFYMEEKVALLIVSRFLDMTILEVKAEGEATMDDVLGEIANMTVGSFKTKLNDQGYEATLTLPSISRGIGLQINDRAGDFSRFHVYDFEGRAFLSFLSLKYATS